MSASAAATVVRPALRFDIENGLEAAVNAGARRIVLRTGGRGHGPITRLVSPSDIGELIEPFVFLDRAEVAPRPGPLFGIHPHSGIATLTLVLRGGLAYRHDRKEGYGADGRTGVDEGRQRRMA
jgi:redox-sensitive bicupin YhaK (pirin superfamily)